MMRPLVGTYVLQLGGTALDASIALAAFSLFPTVLAILIGGVVDGWGTRPILIVGGALMVVGGGLLLVPDLTTVVVSQVVLGLGTLCVWVSLQTSVTTGAGPDESRDTRASRIATFSLFVSFGQTVGPALGGSLQSAGGFALAYSTYAALSLLLFLVAVLALPRAAHRRVRGSVAVARPYRQAAGLLRDRTVVIGVMVSFTALLLHDIRAAWQPLLLHDAGLEQWRIGVVLSASALAGFFARPFFTVLLRALGAPLLVGLVLGVGASTAMLVVVAPGDMPFLVALGAVNGLAVGFAQPLSLTLLSDAVPTRQLGVASGLRSMANQAALLASPAAFGVVSVFATLSAAFLVVGGAAAATGLLSAVLLGLRRPEPGVGASSAPTDGSSSDGAADDSPSGPARSPDPQKESR